MQLQEGDLIFLEEGTDEYLNVTCGLMKGKLSAQYGWFLLIRFDRSVF
jgi:hypothetical protein